jgi:excisionase family DNA binding protein
MERRKLPADQWGWSEGVGEVLSRLDKAREARGSIVGKGLARLAEHLPRELPGSKARIVTKAPAPLTLHVAHADSAQEQSDKKSKKPNTDTRTGRNINILRKECGWSFDDLAKKTLIDKKSILAHVNKGARPIPRILKEYVQAFSKELGRRITAPDLER